MHLKLIGLGQHRHRRRGSVYAPLRLRGGHALHTVHTRLVLERAIHILPRNVEDDFLVAAHGTFGERRHGVFEAVHLKVLGVHAEEVACEEGSLVAARAAANLHHYILAVLGVLRQKHEFDLFLQRRNLRLQFVYLCPRHLFEFGVLLVVEQLLRLLEVLQRGFVSFSRGEHALQIVVVAIEAHVPRLVSNHRWVGYQEANLMKLRLQAFYLV